MASNWSLCGVCETLDLSSQSTVWCLQCDQGLCTDCERRHKACSGTESHQMTPIEKNRHLPADVLKISQTCPEHNERYRAYCDVHECACCFKCTLKAHRKCENLLAIDDLVQGVKASNALRECKTSIAENKENIGIIIKDRQQNISRISEEKTRIQNEIKQTRKKVNEHLVNLETQLLQELSELEEEHTTKLRSLISSLDKKQQEIEEMQGNLSSLKEHASELQIFLSMKKMEKISLSDDAYINKLCSSEDLKNISLSIELDKAFINIEKSVTKFGRISQNSSPSSIVLNKQKGKQAQLHVSHTRSVDRIRLDRIRKINVKKEGLNGCCFLPDGRYVVASYCSSYIIEMTEDGTVDFKISTEPYDVNGITHIPSTNTVAATTGRYGKRRINIIDINAKKIARSILSNTKNYGITHSDRNLYYCAKGVGKCTMNIDTEKVTTVKTIPAMSLLSYITCYRNKLYYTFREANTVTCCSMNGATLWEFKDEKILRYPKGICVDSKECAYVAGRGSNNLIVISPDGSSYSELLTGKDGLYHPAVVDYDKTTNRLLVTNYYQKVFLYEVN